MKEITDIIAAYDRAVQTGKACALATVVHVEGSSYRRPGARMLVTDDGKLTGAISGGCLEGDALRKALLAIREGRNKLVTYDTTDEDDAKLGVQLGCNGIVHILFEPVDTACPNHPLILLKKVIEKRRSAVLSTLFSLKDKNHQPGTCFFHSLETTEEPKQDSLTSKLREEVSLDGVLSLRQQASQIIDYADDALHAFHQFIPPPVSLLIAGAGNDAMPLVAMACLLGWEVTLADGRITHANRQRFPTVRNIVITTPEAFRQQVPIDENTVCVLMSHNYNYDQGILKELYATDTPYIGILGPKAKMERMYADLEKEGILIEDRTRIYSPVGLDIGAETSEEIALSIAAEIKTVLMHRNAAMLRSKKEPVHD